MPGVTRFLLSCALTAFLASSVFAAEKGKTVPLWDGKTFNGWEGDKGNSAAVTHRMDQAELRPGNTPS